MNIVGEVRQFNFHGLPKSVGFESWLGLHNAATLLANPKSWRPDRYIGYVSP